MNAVHRVPPPPAGLRPAQALNWLAAGWTLFLRAPLQWIVQALICFVILAALGMLPALGRAAAPVVMPLLLAGLLAGADRLDRGQPVRIDHLFEGLRQHAGNLLLLGVFHLLATLVAALLATAISSSALLSGVLLGTLPGAGVAAGGILFGTLVFTLLWAFLLMAMWYAPALVMLDGLPPLDAMLRSIQACLHSFLTFIVLAALLFVLGWLALIPAGLGMLVLLPVIAGALHAAWKDTFPAAAPSLPGTLQSTGHDDGDHPGDTDSR